MTVEAGWVPTAAQIDGSRVVDFARWLGTQGIVTLDDPRDYRELHAWSAAEPAQFWEAVAHYFGVDFGAGATEVLSGREMPGARWFHGASMNFAREMLKHGAAERDAIVLVRDDGHRESITFGQLREQVACVAGALADRGVGQGDRVVAYLPNCIEGVVAFLAAATLGAVWSQAGMDYAPAAAMDRLGQLDPTVLIAGTGYLYKGVRHDRREAMAELRSLLPVDALVVSIETGGVARSEATPYDLTWEQVQHFSRPVTAPVEVPFDHPLWVLFTSGTTGRPKGIVHGHGGALLEQLVSPGFHMDLGEGDVFFWFTTPNWMMWNAEVCGLLHGATIVLFDGSPTYPDTGQLWRVVEELGVTVFGTSPGYLQACARDGVEPGRDHDLSGLELIGVTGSVLPASSNQWVREHVRADLQLGSMSGGTDIVGIFVASAPNLPVYDGEISGPALGVALEAWDEEGNRLPPGGTGEMVITRPMPSMPIAFWDDPEGERYRDAYFDVFPGVWRHGDSITITERGTVIIHGRTDSTLNRNGVRLGSAEIYEAVESLPEVSDSLVVGVELAEGGYWMPLFVVADTDGDEELLRARIVETIAGRTSPRHVPDEVIVVPSLPHTRTGKRLEVPVKRILQGAAPQRVASMGAVDDVDALKWLIDFAHERNGGADASATVASSGTYQDWRIYHEQELPRVLSAALDVFAEKGYHGTTTRQLADRSGLSVPGIYHHYKSKQDILLDLMMVVVDELIERSRVAVAEADDEPRAQFDALVSSMLLFHVYRRKGAIVSTSELRSLDPGNRRKYVERRDELQAMLDDVIERGVATGVFDTPYPRDAGRAIASLCAGVATWYRPEAPLSFDPLLDRYLSIAEAIVGVR
ncbi:acetoacetate--CoA ligase [Nocardioides anomalus]|uniref:Acetoacetate--CoA ligase n=1 Tax=Nocardioides anomalus TaxID=2712223 RepID=A0A6G6WIH4_9ACTN|nr:acetoacetate--CoA ligase [Nocardioides anomalus]QIG44860.1 acetoacetate--CoA ligase [Nocardioides anomalus]